MTDFSIQTMIEVIAQTICGGDVQVAGLLVMVAVFFVCLVILASLRAPITYSVVPLLLISVFFTALNIINVALGFVLIIITAVIVAMEVRRTVTGG